MDRLKYIKLENEDGSYSSSIPLAVDSDHVDVNGTTLTNKLSHIDTEVSEKIFPITMNELGNDVKAALTGGAVPYVGNHSIGEEELKYNIPISNLRDIKFSKNYLNFDTKSLAYWNYNSTTKKITKNELNNTYAFEPVFLKGGRNYCTLQRCRGYFCLLLNGTYDSNTGDYEGTIERIFSTDSVDYLHFSTVNDCYCFITTYSTGATNPIILIEDATSEDNEIFNIISRATLKQGETILSVNNLKITAQNFTNNSIDADKIMFLTKNYENDNFINPDKLIPNYFVNYSHGGAIYNTDWLITDFIQVTPGETLQWKTQPFGCQIAYYDENYNFVEGALIDRANTITVPNNEEIVYFVGSIGKENQNNSFLSKTSTSFVPYKVSYSFKDNIKVNITPKDSGFFTEFISAQLFNKDEITEGGYLSYTNGQWGVQPEYFETDFIKTTANTKIAFNYATGGIQVCYFDENKQFISGILLPSGDLHFTVPNNQNIKYFRMNHKLSYLNQLGIMEGESAWYEPYESRFKLKQEYLTNLFYVVDINGGGDFTSLTTAVASVPNKSIIFVKPGIYENEKVKAWTKEIYIIGTSKEACVITNTTNSYTNPPIEMGPGLLKNLTIWAQDGESSEQYRDYAVHVETNTLKDKSLIIENCVLHAANNAGLGMGMRGGCNVYVINSELKGDTTYGLFFHDSENVDYVGIQNFYLRNNIIWSENGTTFMRMDSQCRDGSIINLEFINNTMRSLGSTKDNYTKRNARETSVTEDDFLDLKNFRLKSTSFGNSHNSFNVNRETTG